MDAYLIKTLNGLHPGDPDTQEWYNKLKPGEGVHGNFKKIRNIKFHRKYFALLNVGFENWEPGEVNSKHGKPEKNFDRFRADLTILAGFYETTVRLDGSIRIEPQSIAFANMDEESFQDLYSKTIDVLIKHVYKKELTGEELDIIVEQYLSFV